MKLIKLFKMINVKYWYDESEKNIIYRNEESVDILATYYNTYKKKKFICWVEKHRIKGNRIMKIGYISDNDCDSDGKRRIYPVKDEYEILNAIGELQKRS